MHMTDALISPAVGGTMWAVSGGLIVLCARKLRKAARDDMVPLMGVMGAFIFAAQMINFTIPGTGSSGHLGGGLILAALLGPYAAFLVMASVLTVQAFFFADGGLLALGCNIFNLGFFPAFVAFPLVYRTMAGDGSRPRRAFMAAILASSAGLLFGAFCVVLQTSFSGMSELPFGPFAAVMLAIHLAIGIVEGVATALVVGFVARTRPEVLPSSAVPVRPFVTKSVLVTTAAVAVLLGGIAAWFASTHPDGLEWSIVRITGGEIHTEQTPIHKAMTSIQEKTAFLPDYGFRPSEGTVPEADDANPGQWPAVNAGTSTSGLVGGLITLAFAGLLGLALALRRNRNTPRSA